MSAALDVVFRADASNAIGVGHVSRCLTLARTLVERGIRSTFVCRRHSGHLAEQIDRAGMRAELLPASGRDDPERGPADYSRWLGVSQAEDAAQTVAALRGRAVDWVVCDHYALDAVWERSLRPCARQLMAIDDLPDRDHECDVLLDQNFRRGGAAAARERAPAGCTRLLGPRYALLAPEYARHRQEPGHHQCGRRQGAVRRVLVSFGGSDTAGMTARALAALSRPALADLRVDLVVGANNTHRPQLEAQAAARPGTTLYSDLPHLADLLAAADLAIGAGGTTTWERMCLGVPSLVVSAAENQRPGAEALAAAGLIRYLGTPVEAGVEQLAAAIEAAISDPAALEAQSLRCELEVDGLGAWRVAEWMYPTGADGLLLREATLSDAALYFNWANDPEVRRQSLRSAAIDWTGHQQWFRSKIGSRLNRLFVMQAGSLPVGQIRFDLCDGEARIGFSLDADFRGRGWGRRLVTLGVKQMAEAAGVVFRAEVKRSNPASASVFARLGFREAPAEGGPDLAVYRFDPAVDTLATCA